MLIEKALLRKTLSCKKVANNKQKNIGKEKFMANANLTSLKKVLVL